MVKSGVFRRKAVKTTGFVRKIDDNGKIIIPKEIRKLLFVNKGDKLEYLFVDGAYTVDGISKLILRKYEVKTQ